MGLTTIPKEIAAKVAEMDDAYVAVDRIIIDPIASNLGRPSGSEPKAEMERMRAQVSWARR